MILLRICYGILFGMQIPISQILMTEITPLQYRGRLIVLLQMMYIFGRLWMLGLAAIYLV